ncbi:anaphase-promoting complex subunit 1 isoform X1 [Ananas comosus]|uniref:Anaphase-promoting complex subunit 1 n=1 Tax=Ananas comosus TaxID=4615 RepID=A0A6P5EQT0_ANACO|nr:anaphase-promoting complex subunit 1 isoform X1 [Ananas comosus]
MSIGVRELTVLREFKPFGLIAESMDGDPQELAPDKYDYFLFKPEVVRERNVPLAPDLDFSDPSPASDLGDHELFVRGNRLIWSTGSRVYKRYTSPNTVTMACWCHMDAIPDALLCVLQVDTLSLYNASGEVVSIPLPYAVASIWPLPFGLLLQKSDRSRTIHSSSSLANERDLSRSNKDYGLSHHASFQQTSFEAVCKDNVAMMGSHLILKHPLEEPQATYLEERGKLSVLKDFEEKTIWTSDAVPLMASYHKGKLQHSIWHIDAAAHPDSLNGSSLSNLNEVSTSQFSFRRIWQGKCSQSAASEVFLATDIDGMPIICFLFSEQRILLAVRLQIDEANDDVLIDIKPHMSWSIPAIAAAPVVVTRPRVQVGQLPFADIVVLDSENCLLLYSGRECLCRYIMPDGPGKGSYGEQSPGVADLCYDFKIVRIGDAVEGRINIICNNGKMFRCTLRRTPSSCLVNDCITAMAEGLHLSLYCHFASILWGDNDSTILSNSNSYVDSEWESFSNEILKICTRYGSAPPKQSSGLPYTAWDFLISSKFHCQYLKQSSASCISVVHVPDSVGSEYTAAYIQDEPSQEVSFYARFLRETLDALHALYENLKLNILRNQDIGRLASLLCNIAASLGEKSYVDYYCRDFPSILVEVHSFPSASAPQTPPCLFRWLESCLLCGCDMANLNDIPPLICRDKSLVVSLARKIVSFYSLLLGAERRGRKLSTGVYCEVANGSVRTVEELTVLAMVGERFGRQYLDLLPVGLSLPLRHALDKCRESPPTDWPASAYVLVGREDLAMAKLGSLKSQDDVNLTSISVPYMLHLQPVTSPSSVSDITRSDSLNPEDSDSLYRSVEDGMEHIFNSSTQLRYGRDLRFNEVRRLLCSARPVAIHMSVNPSASNQDLQQHQLWNLAQRTTALPFGRGAFTLGTTYTLLTEALVVPKLVLAGRLPAQQNATVNLDPNIRSISELRSWPEFHNGVAAGLRLAPFQGKMSRTWIQYNKPEEPNCTHAGLLLALGLHGHLRVLTITDVYRYLSQEHDFTTVGVLLGMAASHRGTMHPAISKMLHLHIASRLPSSFLDLELPTILQSAALMGIGLLYEGSSHPLTMKMLLGEIGRRSGGDNVLEREGYSVAAGSALGLVALGRGKDAIGFMDTFVDRLFQYISGKGVYNEKLSNSSQLTDDQNRNVGQMMDGTQLNIDVTAPGAIIAIALIFLKTESEVMAARLQIPTTHFELQYVRPDFIMLRTIARNLILWSRIQPSRDWIESQLPEIVKDGIFEVGDGGINGDEYDAEALVQAYVNVVTGACIALGLKYAGTKNGDAQELLHSYAVYFLNEIKHIPVASPAAVPKGLLQYVDRGTLELCLHLIVLSLSLVMAGSGHLQTFRLLRYLRGRSSADGHMNYGIQMGVSLSMGFLFLGGGMQTFSTGNSAVAALLITLYPRLPTGPNDNRCHLQAFRHLYIIAAESRWVQTADVDTGLPVYCPLEVTIRETEYYAETSYCEVTPCILPERSVLKSVQVCGPRYWPQSIELVPEEKPWWRSGDKSDPFNGGLLYIKRKVGSCSYADDPVGCQSLLSRAMHKVSDTSCISCPTTRISGKENSSYSFKVEQLVNTFSADPSLIAFAQLCCDSSWNSRYDANFQEFCSQVLFECVSKDQPALLQVYLSLYTIVESMWEQVKSGHFVFHDSLFLSSLKLALAYNDALLTGKLSCANGGIIQSTFIESLRKRIEGIMSCSKDLKGNFFNYLFTEKLSTIHSDKEKMDAALLSWYLLWYNIPPPHIVKSAMEKIKRKAPMRVSAVPLLQLLLPTTHFKGIAEITDIIMYNSCVFGLQRGVM